MRPGLRSALSESGKGLAGEKEYKPGVTAEATPGFSLFPIKLRKGKTGDHRSSLFKQPKVILTVSG